MNNKEEIKVLNDLQKHMIHQQAAYALLLQTHESLKDDYSKLYNLVLTILDACDEKTLILHKSHFLRLASEMRIDQSYDEKTGEFTFKLLTLKD